AARAEKKRSVTDDPLASFLIEIESPSKFAVKFRRYAPALLPRGPSEQLPYSPGLVVGPKRVGGANVNMAGVSLRSRDLAYLRFPGAIRALGLQTTHHAGAHLTSRPEAA